MSDMVERVARAIATADEQNGGPPYDHRVQDKHARQALFDEARAAIEAMREPTNAMLKAGVNWDTKITVMETYPHDRGTWRAMIDAALASERKP